MFRKRKGQEEVVGERVPIYKPASCLGDHCEYFSGQLCNSRYELLVATGETGGADKGPLTNECSYALYGKVCTSGDEQVVVQLLSESPNGQASTAELVGRTDRYEGRHIVLTTPADAIIF